MPTCLTELDYPLTDPDIQLRYPHFEHGHAGVDIPLAVLVDLILRKLYPGRAVSIYQAGALPVKRAFLRPVRMTAALTVPRRVPGYRTAYDRKAEGWK